MLVMPKLFTFLCCSGSKVNDAKEDILNAWLLEPGVDISRQYYYIWRALPTGVIKRFDQLKNVHCLIGILTRYFSFWHLYHGSLTFALKKFTSEVIAIASGSRCALSRYYEKEYYYRMVAFFSAEDDHGCLWFFPLNRRVQMFVMTLGLVRCKHFYRDCFEILSGVSVRKRSNQAVRNAAVYLASVSFVPRSDLVLTVMLNDIREGLAEKIKTLLTDHHSVDEKYIRGRYLVLFHTLTMGEAVSVSLASCCAYIAVKIEQQQLNVMAFESLEHSMQRLLQPLMVLLSDFISDTRAMMTAKAMLLQLALKLLIFQCVANYSDQNGVSARYIYLHFSRYLSYFKKGFYCRYGDEWEQLSNTMALSVAFTKKLPSGLHASRCKEELRLLTQVCGDFSLQQHISRQLDRDARKSSLHQFINTTVYRPCRLAESETEYDSFALMFCSEFEVFLMADKLNQYHCVVIEWMQNTSLLSFSTMAHKYFSAVLAGFLRYKARSGPRRQQYYRDLSLSTAGHCLDDNLLRVALTLDKLHSNYAMLYKQIFLRKNASLLEELAVCYRIYSGRSYSIVSIVPETIACDEVAGATAETESKPHELVAHQPAETDDLAALLPGVVTPA